MRTNRRILLLAVLSIFSLLLSSVVFAKTSAQATTQTSTKATAKRPNIIFLLADDMRWDHMGFLGKFDVQTPKLDALAKKGVIFSKYYNTTAICMASRAQLMSGLYEFSTGTNFTHGDMAYSTWNDSYPATLKAQGYYTGFAGKFGFNVNKADGSKGKKETVRPTFDWWAGWMGQGSYEISENGDAEAWHDNHASKKEHTTFALGQLGQDFVQEAVATGKPFNLSISFKAPHTPYIGDPRYKNVYKGQVFDKPKNYGVDPNAPKQALSGRPSVKGVKLLKNYDKVMAEINTMIYGMDVAIGMILDEVKRQGVSDNTIIIFTSDNGHFDGSKGFGGKLYAYEEGSKATTIIYDPRRVSGEYETFSALTGNIDIAPTILDYAGIKAPKSMQGKSMLPLITGKVETTHDSLMLINAWGVPSAQSLAVVTPEAKYIHWFYGGMNGFERSEELFNLTKDPLEQNNLVNNPEAKALLNDMRIKYDNWLAYWQAHGVSDRGYPKYTKLGDRHIPFESNSPQDIASMYEDEKKGKAKKSKKDKQAKKAKKEQKAKQKQAKQNQAKAKQDQAK